uniref:Uncharacterized protein n=1 Tax=Ralstonia solanacearum TaxID=305 RepID=A0A0S4TU66_RALSL|nr:protein of unknown function [Ralstonia solanacearum]
MTLGKPDRLRPRWRHWWAVIPGRRQGDRWLNLIGTGSVVWARSRCHYWRGRHSIAL